jgi:hypothetical protein
MNHQTVVKLFGYSNNSDQPNQVWSFDAKTKAASVSKAMRFIRKGWEIEGDDPDLTVTKKHIIDGLTVIRLKSIHRAF